MCSLETQEAWVFSWAFAEEVVGILSRLLCLRAPSIHLDGHRERHISFFFFFLSLISLYCNWLVRNMSQSAIIEKLHKHELLSWLSCALCLLSFVNDSPKSEFSLKHGMYSFLFFLLESALLIPYLTSAARILRATSPSEMHQWQ